jgi:hypothetical protein
MESRTHVTFEWDNPEEEESDFDDGGDITRPGGHAIAEHIQSGLRKRGLNVTNVEQHEFYGWAFDIVGNQNTVWCMLQFAEPWLLVAEVPSTWWERLKGRKPDAEHAEVCRAIHECLVSGGRASSVRWFSRKDFANRHSSGGAERPDA